MAEPIGPQLIEKLGGDIYTLWQVARDKHPGEDDLVAVLGYDPGQTQTQVTLMTRAAFLRYMHETGRWVDGSAWEALNEPAGARDGTPTALAIWVIIHPTAGVGQGQAEILRLVSPITAKGGDA